MPAKTYPNLGLKGGYNLGENGWGGDMSANLLKLSIVTQGGVLGRVADYPASPADGDIYINTTSQKVGARVEGAWVELVPAKGWLFYDKTVNAYVRYDGAAWGLLPAGLAEAPSDGKKYGRKDGNWSEIVSGNSLPSGSPGSILHYDANGAPEAINPFNGIQASQTGVPYGAHKYWRINVTQTVNSGYALIGEVRLRSAPGGANLTVGGVPMAGSVTSGQEAAKAFDGDVGTYWETGTGAVGAGTAWIGYNFVNPVALAEVECEFNSAFPEERPVAGQIQYSDDGSNWTTAWGFAAWAYPPLLHVSTSPDYGTVGEKRYLVPDASETANRILAKKSGTAGDFKWIDPPAGAVSRIKAKARINFSTAGAMTQVGAMNVQSITRISTGVFRVNFTSAVPANCVLTASGRFGDASTTEAMIVTPSRVTGQGITTTQAFMQCRAVGADGLFDPYESARANSWLYFEIIDPTA